MARNLQAKLPASDTLRIYDINTTSAEKFAAETKGLGNGAGVTIASSPRDAAEDSVSPPYSRYTLLPISIYVMSLFQTNDLSWGLPSWSTF